MTLPIYLIGYMASGKSTVGQLLAQRLGWTFVDLDEAFAEIHGYTTGEYITKFGIEDFRHREKYVVEDLADAATTDHVIYATGGGYPTYEDNMECLRELGTSFYLRWSPEHLTDRLFLSGLDNRPIAQWGMQNAPGENDREKMLHFVTEQLALREPFYRQANYTIDAPIEDEYGPQNDDEIADEIALFIQNYL